jgi:D-alanyl-D-alanine carboxypeptidase
MSDDRLHRLAARLQAQLDRLVGRRRFRHALIAVAQSDATPLWSGAAGDADATGTPMRVDTPWFIASIDKLFTATLVLKLHERGHLALDAPIGRYLPAPLVAGLHRLGGTDHSGGITVHHLLSHTSGLPDWLEDRPRGAPSVVDALLRDGDRAVSVEEIVGHVRERLTPHFPPQPAGAARARIRYSDTNFVLLAQVVRAVAAAPLHEALAALLLRPLGLRGTWVAHDPPAGVPAGVPAPAALFAGGRALDLPRLLASTGAVFSTAADLIAFLSALVHGRVFDDPATFRRMQARFLRFGLPRDRAALRLPPWPIEYGLGLMRLHDPVATRLGRAIARSPVRAARRLAAAVAPPAVIGHTGSTGTWLWHCPDLDVLLAGSVGDVHAAAVPFRLLPAMLRAVAGFRGMP